MSLTNGFVISSARAIKKNQEIGRHADHEKNLADLEEKASEIEDLLIRAEKIINDLPNNSYEQQKVMFNEFATLVVKFMKLLEYIENSVFLMHGFDDARYEEIKREYDQEHRNIIPS